MANSQLTRLIAPLLLLVLLLFSLAIAGINGFEFKEATIDSMQRAFKDGELTSKQLVEYYTDQIKTLNPSLAAVIEVNPDAISLAEKADKERNDPGDLTLGPLHGIPILLKDNIATFDQLNTTAGSYALLGSNVTKDAGVVSRLRGAGAIILGKASLSEWSNFRSSKAPSGWCARSGQGKNPYVWSTDHWDPCGSSSGPAIAAAANMAAVTLGTETDGSILCPSSYNSVVGIKPTAGLASRSGVIPISSRQDNVGPICRTVSDAVRVLDVIVGFDPNDKTATTEGAKFIPEGGYVQFLKADGLKGKRIGILRSYFDSSDTFDEQHFNTMKQKSAKLFDDLAIPNASSNQDFMREKYFPLLKAEFKVSINAYLEGLTWPASVSSPVDSLADIINFNKKDTNKDKEKYDEYLQDIFDDSENTSGVDENAIERMRELSKEGLEKLMKDKKLDAVVTPQSFFSSIMAIGGYPGIIVPAGYGSNGVPFGLCFTGLKGYEPRLIEIAYAFEQATKVRKPPSLDEVHQLATSMLMSS